MKVGYTKYDIDMLMNDPNTHVQIILNDSVDGEISVEGFQTDDFDLSGSASYSTAMEGDMGDIASKAFGDNKITNAFNTVLGAAQKFGGFSNKSLYQSIATWDNCAPPAFGINLMFPAIRMEDHPLEDVKKLMKAVYPREVGAGIVRAPLGYSLITSSLNSIKEGGHSAVGTATVIIGKWFFAPYMIVESVASNVSKFVAANGQPLFCTANVSFRPFREISYEEWLGFFRI